ncbi:hypothetical protein [uncultured Porphyromonas sp.]|uniref:hypothetical protein n=1 Tax=uncultured Porphyromonas sp. TaxID=159274 RepID=UPI00260EBBEA|nr:hypothetical protein [uncultured Porphyromonas sp.]
MNSRMMIASLIMVMSFGANLLAQETLPLHAGVGSEWYYDIASLRVPYGYEYGYIKVAIVQDTVVDETPCLKTVTEFYNERGHLFDCKTGLVLYEGAKAYDLCDGKKYLKYDLDAQEGEEVPIGFNYLQMDPQRHGILGAKAIVEKRELVDIDGHQLIRQLYKIDVRYKTAEGSVVDTLRRSFTQLIGCEERDNLQGIFPLVYDPTGDIKLFDSKNEKLRCFRSSTFNYKAKYGNDCDYVSYPVAVQSGLETTTKLWVEGDKLLWSGAEPQTISVYDMSARLIRSLTIADETSSVGLNFLPKGESYLVVVIDRLGNRYAHTFLL